MSLRPNTLERTYSGELTEAELMQADILAIAKAFPEIRAGREAPNAYTLPDRRARAVVPTMAEVNDLLARAERATFVNLNFDTSKQPDWRVEPEDPNAAALSLAEMAIDLWNEKGFHPASILSGSDPVQVRALGMFPEILGFDGKPQG